MFKCPVAPEIVKVIDPAYKQIDEFRMMNYTPVTCSPEEFGLPENGYTLRPRLFGRRTELLIAITSKPRLHR
jgi:chitin synthase